ncbi:MAG TPA: MerR family transcriptional regulator, partial [Blastocatellia bacterium]|nr:MerR family transcriptional regulator [Blastocatellia bacterium]
MGTRRYTVHEFAELAGVTVRALHHYDRLGLLRARRSGAGYRVYSPADLERLEQIVTLKFLGLPLKQIKVLLDREPLQLPEALQFQRQVLEEKRRRLDQAIGAIQRAEKAIQPGKPIDSTALQTIIEVIGMQNDLGFMKKYFSEQAWAKRKERRSKGGLTSTSKLWMDLFADVEDAFGEDPAGERAQALV